MKAQELRIGNWYKGDDLMGGEHQITPKDIENLFDDPQDDFYQPIPLTEEWLLKFGFEKEDDGYLFVNEIALHKSLGGTFNYSVNYFEHSNLEEVKHVHQLQNLYFALTGEELEIVK